MTTTDLDVTQLICRSDVPKYYPALTKKRLNTLAHEGAGPEYTIIANKAWYKREDIEAYLKSICKKPDLATRRKRHEARKLLADAGQPSPRQKIQSRATTARKGSRLNWGNFYFPKAGGNPTQR